MSTKYTEIHIIDVACDIEGCSTYDKATRKTEHAAERELTEKGWKLIKGADRLFGRGMTLCPKHNQPNNQPVKASEMGSVALIMDETHNVKGENWKGLKPKETE